ncbi:kinase-like domain-containing protein [Calycina marina]|uniref:Kinase-like domain-containing protein n=1 Tax=Calycina marina TaxID=1763456 RepID=A0A9P8CCF0_9HELO|nr:kinase-like domain-containing protein [Calycina marina]
MTSFYPLPFFATSDRLPAPLPTIEAIITSPDVVQESTGRRVVRVGHHFLVKYGLNVTLIEGENMLFVGQYSSIPIPHVYAIYADNHTRVNYIVMENVEGQSLASCWTTLSTTAKTAVAERLRDVFDQLRNLPCPGYFGSLGNRPLEDSMFWTPDDATTTVINGSFETESQLNEAMVRKYLYNNMPPQKAEFYRRILPLVLKDHNPVFSHADVQRKNIMMRNDGGLVIIDWETAGWYPSYWEYTLAIFTCGRWDDDWHVWVPRILDEYPNEYAWMDMLRRELWS